MIIWVTRFVGGNVRKSVLAAALGGLCLGGTAADATVYTDRASFDAAFPFAVTDDFESVPAGTVNTVAGGLVNVRSGVPTANGGRIFFYPATGSHALSGPTGLGRLFLTFNSPVFGFAFDDLDLIGGAVESANVGILLKNGDMELFSFNDPDFDKGTTAFFGYGSATAINVVLIWATDISSFDPFATSPNLIDNFSIAAVTAPEPVTLSLFGAGLIGATMLRRRAIRK